MDITTYRDGTTIPQVTDPTQWANLTTGAWCYYNNNPANGNIYGKLYNWYAVNDSRGLAPQGWHIPTDAEWTMLSSFLQGEGVAGGKMKSTGTTLWQSPNAGASNSSGFTGHPGGMRPNNGLFVSIGQDGNWWSSSESTTINSWGRNLFYYDGAVSRMALTKKYGMSVRYIKD